MSTSDIFVTGVGAITPRGDYTLHEGWTNGRLPTPHRDDFVLTNYLTTPKTYLDRCSALSLAGCALALRDAGNPILNGPEAGIALGLRAGCLDTMRTFWDTLAEKGARLAPPLLFSHSMLNTPASLCAIEWGLQGPHITLCAGAESGLEAVRTAWDALRLGRASTILCGGVEAFTPSYERLESDIRAEAACCFVLERTATPGQGAYAVSEEWFAHAEDALSATQQRFGDCGGAIGALAFLSPLSDSTMKR